jgi:NAD+ diphosphatase
MSRSVFDRAAHRRGDEEWLARAWADGRALLISPDSRTRARQVDGALQVDLVPTSELDAVPHWFIGVHDDVPYFAVPAEDGVIPAEGGADWVGARQLAGAAELELDLLVTAVALNQWHGRHPYCPRCGTMTEIAQAGWTRRCPADGSEHFPRTDPAVIMLVHDGPDRCLLGRGVKWPEGRFSTLAGFVEPGESAEAAVAREVMEEVGILVDDVRFVASQPWPFPSSLMLGFTARLAGPDKVRPDGVEVADAGWFSRDEVARAADWTDVVDPVGGDPEVRLRAIPPRLSVSRYLIDGWFGGALPI